MGKGSEQTIGYHYRVAFHVVLTYPIDAFLEFRAADKVAWDGSAQQWNASGKPIFKRGSDRPIWMNSVEATGAITSSQRIQIGAPMLFGGPKDQGGIVGAFDIMFGEADQLPNPYLQSVFGDQTAAWRGFTSVVCAGARFGAMNPMPQKPSYKVCKILNGWDEPGCWYPEKAPIGHVGKLVRPAALLVTGTAKTTGGPVWATANVGPSMSFVGLATSTGADLPQGSPAYGDDRFVVVHEDGVRYTDGDSEDWLSGTISSTEDFGDLVGGSAGWLTVIPSKDASPTAYVAPSALPLEFTRTALAATSTGGGDASSRAQECPYIWQVGDDCFLGCVWTLFRSATAGGPYVALWDAGKEGEAGRNPNQDCILGWYDTREFQGDWYAVIEWDFRDSARRNQIIRSHNGLEDWTTFDVVVDVARVAPYGPAQLCVNDDHAVCLNTDGTLWTSANGWAEPIATGLAAPGTGTSGVIMAGARHIVEAHGLFYCIGSGDKVAIFDPETLTVELVTLPIGNTFGIAIRPEFVPVGAFFAMNPAHALYYVRTGSEKGREPRANINDASLRAAADRLYAEGFGLCWIYDPARDTPDSFEEHICRIIGGSFERSLTDGQWYLDLARGDYDIDSLPIIGDDDILDFKELPTTLDRAVNSVAVKYFDVERKETVITPAVRALGLIRRFGEIYKVLDFPEIPTGDLALRVAERELRAYVTPTRTFDLANTPRTKHLRKNQYFRLQSPKRRIADMVCIVGSQEQGTLKSGAIRRKASQDVYALPDTSYIEIEEGVDTRPPTTPVPIEHAKVFEAPYIDVCATLPRTELEALGDDAGFLLAVAADPGVGLSYAVAVQPSGGDYMLGSNGEWCPTTTTAGAHPAEIGPTVVALASVAGLPEIGIGEAVLWDDEWCRLDAIDYDTLEATLARGCADTVPQPHAAGSRLWFYVEAAYSPTEYTDGEAVNVKLLPETGTRQLPLDSAAALPLEFDARQARPYPPAGLLINGEEAPATVIGEAVLTWVHRDRVLQADQLVDQATAGIGPEAGMTYNVRWYLNAVPVHSETGITGTTASYTPAEGGLLRIEVESERGGLASWQMHVREISIGGALQAEGGTLVTTETDEPILME